MTNAQSMTVCASHNPAMSPHSDKSIAPEFRAGLARAKQRVADFDPTCVVVFGSDHIALLKGIRPPLTLIASGRGIKEFGRPEVPLNVPTEQVNALSEILLDHDFDPAVATDAGLDHGFTHTLSMLFDDYSTPKIIPILINAFAPPMMSYPRAAEVGRLVGDYCREHEERPLFIGTGGLSHDPASMDFAKAGLDPATAEIWTEGEPSEDLKKLMLTARPINEKWDADFIQHMNRSHDELIDWLDGMDVVAEAGSGAAETRTWVAALCAGARPVEMLGYNAIPQWITGLGVAAS
ncbi:MAG: hypothetical protein GDA55_00455 [Cellvibrionales bacterium]|nr:hypothetical protein [Cellvibrionales bacterium]